MYKNPSRTTEIPKNHETQKQNPYLLSNSSINSTMQLKAINAAVFQSNSTTLNTLDCNGVIQLNAINARQGPIQWYSTDAFDRKHLGPEPATEEAWINWRRARWPGFSRTLPAYTLIIGDLNDALLNGRYRDYNVRGWYFTVVVTCDARSIQPLNRANPLSSTNILIANHEEVRLGGFLNQRGSRKINHLDRGL